MVEEIKIYQKKVLILAVRAGELMMKNGAEMYRVEDTVERICKACRVPYVEVFATPTGIFVSLDGHKETEDMHTYFKRIRGGGDTNLSKISMINNFSREFTTTDLTIDQGMKRLKEIAHSPQRPLPIRLLGAALTTSFFSLLFGGNVLDFLCATIIGTISFLLSLLLQRLEINFFIRGMCCCAVAAFMALSVAAAIPAASYNPIIIGTMMLFVPGVAITNSIREFLSGDIQSGVTRLAEAFLIAISLAAGTGIVIRLWYSIGGGVL